MSSEIERLANFCEQTARDGILPSLAWFAETAETLRAALVAPQPETELRKVLKQARELQARWSENARAYKASAPKQCCIEAAHDFGVIAATIRDSLQSGLDRLAPHPQKQE